MASVATIARFPVSPSFTRADYTCDMGDTGNTDCITYVLGESCDSAVLLDCPHGMLTKPLTLGSLAPSPLLHMPILRKTQVSARVHTVMRHGCEITCSYSSGNLLVILCQH